MIPLIVSGTAVYAAIHAVYVLTWKEAERPIDPPREISIQVRLLAAVFLGQLVAWAMWFDITNPVTDGLAIAFFAGACEAVMGLIQSTQDRLDRP